MIHDKAWVESQRVGDGTRVWAYTHILPGAVIGKNCNICEQVYIENKVIVGDGCTIKCGVYLWDGVSLENNVFVGPNATFTNDPNPRAKVKKNSDQLLRIMVKEGATIGANATLLPGITVGEHAFIAAGALVTKDVSPYQLMLGAPAKAQGFMCRCATRHADLATAQAHCE